MDKIRLADVDNNEDPKNIAKPLVSVIVPMYNCENTIWACIYSILRQTCFNYEIVVIDDGSTDNSCTVVREMMVNSSKIRLFKKENGGVSSARNKGLEEAQGDYVCFVDADDEISSYYIEELIKNIASNDIAICALLMVGIKQTNILNYQTENIVVDLYNSEYDRITDIISWWGMYSSSNKLFKKSIIEKYDLKFDTDLTCGEDHLFVLEYLKYCKRLCLLSEPLYKYNSFRSGGGTRFFKLEDSIKLFNANRNIISGIYGIDSKENNHFTTKLAIAEIYNRTKKFVGNSIPANSGEKAEMALNYYWKWIDMSQINYGFSEPEKDKDIEWFITYYKLLTKGKINCVIKKEKIKMKLCVIEKGLKRRMFGIKK